MKNIILILITILISINLLSTIYFFNRLFLVSNRMEDSDNIRYNSRIRVLEKHGEKHEGIVEFFDRSNGRLVLKNGYYLIEVYF